jgi:hypothetical protein
MPLTDPFEILGIKEIGATAASVKKAYSVKLKVTRPDDDPEGFMALRDAYNQAKNRVQWLQNVAATDDLDDTKDSDQTQEKPEEIKYRYDKKLDFHFNSSPSGKLIEKTMRWILEEKAANPDRFFDELIEMPAFSNKPDFEIFKTFLMGRIFFDAGGEDDRYSDDDSFIEEPVYKTVSWLNDATILRLHEIFNHLGQDPKQEWDARQLNCIKQLFEPVLLKHGAIQSLSKPYDIVDYRAKEIEGHHKDEHGSYYDRKKHTWVDMSPVGLAMRDIEELIKIPWENASDDAWRNILGRDTLQALDEFQDLDARLRQFLCQKTGLHQGKDEPYMPAWLSKAVVLLLDDTFGWGHQTGRQMWEHDQYRWLHQIIEVYRDAPNAENFHISWEKIDRNSFAFLGYQPMAWYVKAENILYLYFGYRLLLTFARMI